ncbi:MAG: hypothetical protein L3J93_04950 [Thermoplasmata archaeon]|nr:hypothetical protein [Thermoplasmata archaeon]
MASDPRGADGREELPASHLLWLVALVLGIAFLLLEPLLTFAVFGSDTGEYVGLTQSLLSTGHLPHLYQGWGTAYPDFPGTFLLGATVAGVTGSSALSTLSLTLPVIAALSVLPLFLLFRRIFPNDSVAILGAAIASVAFPRTFSLAHPAPLALGDVLAVTALWMFVEGRRDPRWYLPLALTSGALIVTHHLSSYFFVLLTLGGLLAFELYRPTMWSRRFPLRELVFLGAFLTILLAYWAAYAQAFLPKVSGGLVAPGLSTFLAFDTLAIVAVVLVGGTILWRRKHAPRASHVRFPSDRSVLRDASILLVATFAGALLLVSVPLPGTDQTTTVAAVVFFAPILALVFLASGTRRLVTASRLGPLVLGLLGMVGVSALATLATNNAVVSPARHAEYLVIPLALLVAVGIGRLVGRWEGRWGRPGILAGAVVALLLVSANGAIANPPQADFGGFQEGLTYGDAALWGWTGIALAPGSVVASDHRLSSMVFGLDRNPATWDSTPELFTGCSLPQALGELHGGLVPGSGEPRVVPLDAVAVDATMRGGVALDPSALAKPMSSCAIAWFSSPPFVPLYVNGLEAVYWVDGPIGPPP